MSDQTLATLKQIPAAELGGPDAPDPELCAAVAIRALGETAGESFRMASLALDMASHAIGVGMIEISTTTDKRARAIVFVSLEARIGGAMVFSAQGLFSAKRG